MKAKDIEPGVDYAVKTDRWSYKLARMRAIEPILTVGHHWSSIAQSSRPGWAMDDLDGKVTWKHNDSRDEQGRYVAQSRDILMTWDEHLEAEREEAERRQVERANRLARDAAAQVAHDGLVAPNQRYDLGLTLHSHHEIVQMEQKDLVALITKVVDQVTEEMY